MSDNKVILKNSLVLYIRLFLTSVISLFSVRYILLALGASDFGLYTVVGGIVFLAAFLNNVMVSTTNRYIAFELGKGDNEGVNKVFNISVSIHIFLAFITVILSESLGVFYIKNYLNIPDGTLSDALFVFRLSIFSAVFTIISVPYQGLITAKENFTVSAVVDIIRSVFVFFAVLIVFNLQDNRLRIYTILIAIISLLSPLFYYFYCKSNYRNLIKWKFQKESFKYKEMLGFSVWILLGASSIAAETKISEVVINVFFGTILNASFGIASNINFVLKTFAYSLNRAIVPQITKSFSSGNLSRTMELAIFSSKYSFYLLLLPAIPLLLETQFILEFWLKDVPEYTIVFVQLMVINSVIQVMNSGIPAVIQATGKIKYFQIILSTIHFSSLPVAFLFLKAGYEPHMMIVPFTFSALINLVLEQFLLKKLIQFDIKEFITQAYFKMLLVLFPVAIIFFIHQFFVFGVFRFISFSIISILFILVMIYIVGISTVERSFIKNYIKNKVRII